MVLSYKEALHHIDKGKISPVYLLYGEEEYLQEKLIAAIRSAWLTDILPDFNESKEDGNQLTGAQIIDMANQLPFMAPRRLLLIDQPTCLPYTSKNMKSKNKDEDDDLSQKDMPGKEKGKNKQDKCKDKGKGSNQALLDYLQNPAETTCLILWCHHNKPDKRSKLVSAIEKMGGMVETTYLKPTEAISELGNIGSKAGKNFGPGALEYLVRCSQPDLRTMTNELEKCITYAGDAPSVDRQMIQEIMTPSLEADIFNLVDCMGKKQTEPSIQQLRGLLTRGEPGIKILFMMIRQFRLIFRAKIYLNKGYLKPQIVKALECHPFVAEKVMQQSKSFNFQELEKIMERLLDKDLALKSGTSPWQALESLILELGALKTSK